MYRISCSICMSGCQPTISRLARSDVREGEMRNFARWRREFACVRARRWCNSSERKKQITLEVDLSLQASFPSSCCLASRSRAVQCVGARMRSGKFVLEVLKNESRELVRAPCAVRQPTVVRDGKIPSKKKKKKKGEMEKNKQKRTIAKWTQLRQSARWRVRETRIEKQNSTREKKQGKKTTRKGITTLLT